MNQFIKSKTFKIIIVVIAFIAVSSLIFQAGEFVGFHKASFLFKSGDNFYRTYGERGGMMGGMMRNEFTGGHGVSGKVVKVDLPTLVVLGSDNIEKVVLTDSKTEVRQYRDVSTSTNLSLDQYITVLGSPNDQGQIVARFIRIIPQDNVKK